MKEIKDKSNLCIVAPDAGAIKRAKAFQKHFEYNLNDQVGIAFMHKQRTKANVVDEAMVIGDVKGMDCIIVDDMVDTGGTLCKAADELQKHGAGKIYAIVTHGLFSGPAPDRFRESVFEKIVCTDSVVHDQSVIDRFGGKLHKVSIDLFLAEIIRRTQNGESVQELFEVPKYKN